MYMDKSCVFVRVVGVCPPAAKKKKAEVKVKPLFNLLPHTSSVCKQLNSMTGTHGDDKAVKKRFK